MDKREQLQEMHEAALRVLNDYERTGEPFALFLSSWGFDSARGDLREILGESGEVQARIGLERQVRIVLGMDAIQTIAIQRAGDEKRIAIPTEWPSLIPQKDWKEQIAKIASISDLIILFWGIDSPSILEELEICSAVLNALRTVLVVPADPRDIFLHQLHRMFPRIVPLNEIPPLYPLHPEFMSLIDRMKAIKAISPERRHDLIDPSRRVAEFPIPPSSGRFEGDMWVEYGGRGFALKGPPPK